MTAEELIGSEAWSVVHKECWEMWKMGLEMLRKSTTGIESAHAKQQMLDAEKILKIPLGMNKDKEQRARYYSQRNREEEGVLKGELNKSVRGEGHEARTGR